MKDSAAGNDEVTTRMLKSLRQEGKRQLHLAVVELWTLGPARWPAEVSEVFGFRLYKKGDRAQGSNYRTLWLINTIVRIIGRIISTRLQEFAESRELLPQTQWGFRPGRSIMGPLFGMRCIAEAASEVGKLDSSFLAPVVLILLDIEKAYPSVPRTAARSVFVKMGCPAEFADFLIALHGSCGYRVRTAEGRSRVFHLHKGFREGDPSSPVCFNIYHSNAVHALREELRRRVGGEAGVEVGWHPGKCPGRRGRPKEEAADAGTARLLDLLFADDSSLLCRLPACELVEEVAVQVLGQWGERVHPGKMERICFGKRVVRAWCRRRRHKSAEPVDSVSPLLLPDKFQREVRLLGGWASRTRAGITSTHRKEDPRGAHKLAGRNWSVNSRGWASRTGISGWSCAQPWRPACSTGWRRAGCTTIR